MSTVRATNFQHASAAAPAIVLAADGTAAATVSGINGGPLAGFRNAIINGGMLLDQRNAGAAQTFTNNAALAYCVDRWYGFCAGANVTGQQVQGATVGQFRYRFTGAASVTGITFGQRIEQLSSAYLAGSSATLSVDLANSLLTSVTWTAFYANTADTFGTRASPTRTQIATGTFTVNSTVSRYSTTISIPAAATTGIEIVFSVGAQTSGTWTIGDVQLELGPVATPFERRPIAAELALCQRYFYSLKGDGAARTIATASASSTDGIRVPLVFPVTMRAVPSFSGAASSVQFAFGGTTYTVGTIALSGPSVWGGHFLCSSVSGGTIAVREAGICQTATSGVLSFDAEL